MWNKDAADQQNNIVLLKRLYILICKTFELRDPLEMEFIHERSQFPRLVQDGDVVILYEGYKAIDHCVMKKDGLLQNKHGAFYHNDIIGKPFGQRAQSFSTSSFTYILEPTPELWSLAVRTRTQIVDDMDQSLITFQLNVHPGDIVVESGTGSGCMTAQLARAVYDQGIPKTHVGRKGEDKNAEISVNSDNTFIKKQGHVYSFEYNQHRADEVGKEMLSLGLQDLVSITCADVCDMQGFRHVPPNSVDAIFLDLPRPWLALDHALTLLKPNKNICCYSPCIEQVINTCTKLRELGFHTIRMLEVRRKIAEIKTQTYEDLDLGWDRAEDGSRVIQDAKAEEISQLNNGNKDSDDGTDGSATATQMMSNVNKKRKVSPISAVSDDPIKGDQEEDKDTIDEVSKPYWVSQERISQDIDVVRYNCTMKGHTAFLTFAVSPISK